MIILDVEQGSLPHRIGDLENADYDHGIKSRLPHRIGDLEKYKAVTWL